VARGVRAHPLAESREFQRLAITLADALAYDRIEMDDVLNLRAIRRQIRESPQIEAETLPDGISSPCITSCRAGRWTCCSRAALSTGCERSWWWAAPGSQVRKHPLAVTRVR
jgi:hypothetical protein